MSTNIAPAMTPQSLQQQIQKIERYGEVAPPNTWISSYVVTKKSGKSYKYYRLMTNKRDRDGKLKRQMVKYLGSESSQAYKNMVKAIARRNQIQALQRRLKRLQEQSKVKTQHSGRRRSVLNSPLTKDQSLLLCQLQQQMGELMGRFEGVEQEIKQLKGKCG